MNRTRTVLAGGVAVVAVAVVAGGAIAGGSDAPPAESLPQAIHDAIVAPPVKGITARITFTNKVIDSSSLSGGGAR
jgi:hypothetical protein